MVRRDAGRGVIGRPVAVGDLDHTAPEALGDLARRRRTRHRERHTGAQPGRADLAVGQGHERMERRPQRVRRQCVEPERAGEVRHRGPRDGFDRRGDPRDGVVGGRDDEHVDPVGRARQVVAPPGEPAEGPAARRQRCGKGRAGPTGTDDPDGVHLTSFGVPAPDGCRSPTVDLKYVPTDYPHGRRPHQTP